MAKGALAVDFPDNDFIEGRSRLKILITEKRPGQQLFDFAGMIDQRENQHQVG
jgi:hypothetical protein